jgi:hypothetical protein
LTEQQHLADYGFDRITISVLLLGPAFQLDPAPATFVFDMDGGTIDALAVRDEVIAALKPDGHEYPLPYDVAVNDRTYSWGASGRFLDVMVMVAEGAAGQALYDSIKEACQRIAEHAQRGHALIAHEAVTRDQAEHFARWHVEARYGVHTQDLRLVSDGQLFESGEWTFGFEYDGVRYDVTIAERDRLVQAARIQRSVV